MIQMVKLTFRTMQSRGNVATALRVSDLDEWIEWNLGSWRDVVLVERYEIEDEETYC